MDSIEVRQSPIHGRGVFATSEIPKDRQIIEYKGKRVPWKDVPDVVDETHTFLFGVNDGADVIDPSIDGNEARWINHSCEPNCEAIEEEGGRIFIEAIRNIAPGEELFYDYQLELDEKVTEQVRAESRCFCGASRCRGDMLETAETE